MSKILERILGLKPFEDEEMDELDEDSYFKSLRIEHEKLKEKTFFDDVIIPEYEMEKQKMRDKRKYDQKYKHKNKKDIRDY